MSASSYVFLGSHAETLGNGRPIGPGDEIPKKEVDLDDPHNKSLVDSGALADKPEASKSPNNKKED